MLRGEGVGEVMGALRHAPPLGPASVRPLLHLETYQYYWNAGKSYANIQHDGVDEVMGSLRHAPTLGLPSVRPLLHSQVPTKLAKRMSKDNRALKRAP